MATTIFAVLSALLTVANLIQWIIALQSGNSLRARAQASYNDWYRVAQLAEQIRREPEPEKARELAGMINGLADASRNNIISYGKEHLRFAPSYVAAYEPKLVEPPRGFVAKVWDMVRLGFLPK